MSNKPSVRYCKCGARLARDNPDQLCGPCRQRRVTNGCPPEVPAEFWETEQLREAFASWHIGSVIRAYRHHPFHGPHPLSQELVGGWAGITQVQLSRIENGPSIRNLDKLIEWALMLRIPARYLWFDLPGERRLNESAEGAGEHDPTVDESEALELAQRVESSDVSSTTLARLAGAVNDLCCSYASTPPKVLLSGVRHSRRSVARLLDGKATLAEKRELLVHAGWLCLLGATVLEDVGARRAADANRQTAHQLGIEAGHRDLMAWAFEIQAWQALLDGCYADAVAFAQAGQTLAGSVTSVSAQLRAQEARAWGRRHKPRETYAALEHVGFVAARLPKPAQPDHHFVFDPQKLTSYTATTLTWLGDAERAEEYAREVLRNYVGKNKPRRVATARIDLALAVARQDRPEEACHLGTLALASGRLVRSNIWRVGELDQVLAHHYGDLNDVREFHEHYGVVKGSLGLDD
jgi:hypothetical protein